MGIFSKIKETFEPEPVPPEYEHPKGEATIIGDDPLDIFPSETDHD